jgi:hypothetical protein
MYFLITFLSGLNYSIRNQFIKGCFFLQLSKLKEEHMDELSRVNQDLEDESCSRYSMDKTLADLRSEVSAVKESKYVYMLWCGQC